MSMSFAFWASSLSGNVASDNSNVLIGQWYEGTPIFTVDEFIDMLTIDGNTNTYVLARDLDFNNITPAAWTQTKDVRFMGSLDGLNHQLKNISLTNYRGLFGIIDGGTVKNLVLDSVHINYNTNDTYTSGILAGRLQGSNNIIDNVRIINSSVTNQNVFSGGLFGFASPLSGTGSANISNVEIKNSTISGNYNGETYGNGGLIGTTSNFTMTISDIYVEATIISNNLTSSGGLIGSTLAGSNININRAVINSSIQVLSTTNNANVGSGGIIGRNQGTVSASNVLFTGDLRAYVTNSTKTNYTVRAGVIAAAGNTVTTSNVKSSQISLYKRTSEPSNLITNKTTYNKMTGQKPSHSSTVYVNATSSLTTTWWDTNYSMITALTNIWEYNQTTHLYELKDE